MTDEKQKYLVKLLLGFPSMATADKTQMAGILASYLETLSIFSSQAVSDACDVLRKRPSSFPPTAGEVYAECENAAARLAKPLAKPLEMDRYKLAPPLKQRFTQAQLADWEFPINHASPPYFMRGEWNGDKCAPFKIPHGYPGAGKPAEYGYLTPKEVALQQRSRTNDDTRFADMDHFAREVI